MKNRAYTLRPSIIVRNPNNEYGGGPARGFGGPGGGLNGNRSSGKPRPSPHQKKGGPLPFWGGAGRGWSRVGGRRYAIHRVCHDIA